MPLKPPKWTRTKHRHLGELVRNQKLSYYKKITEQQLGSIQRYSKAQIFGYAEELMEKLYKFLRPHAIWGEKHIAQFASETIETIRARFRFDRELMQKLSA
jgi:hypothetical protein